MSAQYVSQETDRDNKHQTTEQHLVSGLTVGTC